MEPERETTALDGEAKSICRWATARTAVIMLMPIVADIALTANEVYMIMQIAAVYGVKINEAIASAFIGTISGDFAGRAMVALTPYTIVGVPRRVFTHAIGVLAIKWMKDGAPMDMGKYIEVFETVKEESKTVVAELSQQPFNSVPPLGNESYDFSFIHTGILRTLDPSMAKKGRRGSGYSCICGVNADYVFERGGHRHYYCGKHKPEGYRVYSADEKPNLLQLAVAKSS